MLMPSFIRKLVLLCAILILFSGIHHLKAQLCSGSLGSPVVNITFGSGTVKPSNISGFTTTYNYVGTSCPLDGNYTIMSSSPYCFGGTWWQLSTDHTPNSVNGDMMIINASNAPSDFFIDTVSGLCSSTTYEFAAWILNLNVPSACGGNPVKGDITFSIETTGGTVIQQYQTGSIPLTNGPVWKQYGFFFTAPPNTASVVIRMRNNAPGGCGNDLAIDDITLRPCGPLVRVSNSTNSNHINSCSADTTHFTFNSNVSVGFNNIHYQWQQSSDSGKTWIDIAGATNATYNLVTNTLGYYLFRLTVADGTSTSINDCRVVSDTIFYSRIASPVSDLTKNIMVCTGDSVIQKGNTAYSYLWTGPLSYNSNQVNLILKNVTVAQSGKYFAKISTAAGCSIIDSFLLQVSERPVAWAIADTGVCWGDTITLKGGGGTTYIWKPSTYLLTPNDSITKAYPSDSIIYKLYASNGNCTDSQTVKVNVWQKPTASISPLQTIGTGQSETIIGQISGSDVSYNWTPLQYLTNANTLTPSASPIITTMYYLTVNSSHNCGTAIDSAILRVNNSFYIPNALAPSAIGNGDVSMFKVYGASVKSAVMMVYNQWGQMVFKSDNATLKGWDGSFNGTAQPSGVYVYVVKIIYYDNKTETRSGSINLIR